MRVVLLPGILSTPCANTQNYSPQNPTYLQDMRSWGDDGNITRYLRVVPSKHVLPLHNLNFLKPASFCH
jgi:hypothetical protein